MSTGMATETGVAASTGLGSWLRGAWQCSAPRTAIYRNVSAPSPNGEGEVSAAAFKWKPHPARPRGLWSLDRERPVSEGIPNRDARVGPRGFQSVVHQSILAMSIKSHLAQVTVVARLTAIR